MILKKYNSTTPGLRHRTSSVLFFSKNIRFKFSLIKKKKNTSRSIFNGILIRTRRSPRLKKNLRVCFNKSNINKVGILIRYHHYKSIKAIFGLFKFSNGSYITSAVSHGLLPGDYILSTNLPNKLIMPYLVGYTVMLYWLPKKAIFFNLVGINNKNSHIARSAGTCCTVIEFNEDKEYSRVRIPSGIIKLIYSISFVVLGRNSNIFNKKKSIGKAGLSIYLGKRSSVRGVAMNPVDHPNGGRTKTNSPEKTPWGRIAKKSK